MASSNSSSSPFPAFSMDLPPYVLLEVFEYLPGQDLVVASHTCKLWYQLVNARRRLRANSFIPSSYNPSYPIEDTELHPVISQIHFDQAVDADKTTYGVRRDRARAIMKDPVSSQLATCPAVTELRLDVMKYHPHVVVQNSAGVKVSDVVRELCKYKSFETNFTFQEFFGPEICSQRGYERRTRMRRVDMVEDEKVLVTFAEPEVFNGTVLFRAERFRPAKGGRNERKHNADGYRFWSAFAFEK